MTADEDAPGLLVPAAVWSLERPLFASVSAAKVSKKQEERTERSARCRFGKVKGLSQV